MTRYAPYGVEVLPDGGSLTLIGGVTEQSIDTGVEINAEVTGRLTETLNGVRVIKGFNAEASENKTFEHGAIRLYENVKSVKSLYQDIHSICVIYKIVQFFFTSQI